VELRNIGKASQIARELAYQSVKSSQIVISTFRASRGRKYRAL
jgi:hypothetical protein